MEQTAESQRQRRAQLEQELAELNERRSLAERRLSAYQAEQSGAPREWLGTPSEITAMRVRLSAASTDNDQVMKLVDDLRQKRDSITNEALRLYAAKMQQ